MNTADPHLVRALSDPDASDPGHSGGKGANLAALVRAGLPVPAGFVVGTSAYRRFVQENRLDVPIGREIARLSDDPATAEAASQRLRQEFESAGIPGWLRESVEAAYRALGEGPVAVRSSATAEDLPEASFAGQQETVLDVVGTDELCAAVRRCWSSLWTTRAIAYRRRNGIEHEQVAVAVVVQRMVPAEVAGVLFTADPVSGRRDHVVVEAAAGLGDAVVSGKVTPDRWVVDASSGTVVTRPERNSSGLTEDQLADVVELGLRAAAEFGSPQDVEWALADGRCRLLQSRPITSLFPLPPARDDDGLRVYLPVTLVAQGFTEPMTPAGNAFFRAMASLWVGYWTTGSRHVDPEIAPPWLPTVLGRLFVDFTPILQRRWLAHQVMSSMAMKDPTTSAVLQEWLERNADRLPRPIRGTTARRLVRRAPEALSALGGFASAIAAPSRHRRRVLGRAEAELVGRDQEAARRSTPLAQVDFVDRVLPAATLDLITVQLPAVYAEMLSRTGAEWLVRRWLGSSPGLEPVRRWLPHNPTLAMGAELARLAHIHAATGTEPSANDADVREFLEVYGHRAPDREIDLGLPRLTEDPAYIVELIRGYVRSGDAQSRFEAGEAAARVAADELVASVRRAKGRPHALVLRILLRCSRELGGLREWPKFDMVRAIALGRRTLRRVGTALVSDGRLDDPDDVFFVDPADLRATLAGDERDLRASVIANRHEYEHELSRRAVPRLLVSDGETVYGPATAPVAERPGVLTGTPVSPGVHEGVVRVLDSPVGAQLRPGEILVAATTDPGWTPLFLLAGALVMEVGGVVSHGAVVAREYGLPAVAAVADATSRLRTGQRVRVDGGDGTVTVLEPDQFAAPPQAIGMTRSTASPRPPASARSAETAPGAPRV
ncbi:PEP/pyruvate-binding domain-containing protein [Pseudonocardia zijingensis]|uniref:Phosphoenolpyruvate synthase n=1 Tax=Pseudonocardia zijingensis TaxID=153376 RepID=A0ABN1P5K7_9PSEU